MVPTQCTQPLTTFWRKHLNTNQRFPTFAEAEAVAKELKLQPPKVHPPYSKPGNWDGYGTYTEALAAAQDLGLNIASTSVEAPNLVAPANPDEGAD